MLSKDGRPLLAALFLYLIVSASSQRFISKCYRNDLSLSKCLEDAANKYLSELNADGLELEFSRNGVSHTVKQDSLDCTFNYRNVRFYNLTNSHLNLSYNKRTKTVYGKMIIPYSRIYCYFDATGTFGKVDLRGGGHSNIDFWDLKASFISKIVVNEDHQVELEPLYYSLDHIGRADMDMFDIVAPTMELGESFRMVMKHFGDLVMRLVKPELKKSFEVGFALIGAEVVQRILRDGVYEIDY